jgi:hypothetical protein
MMFDTLLFALDALGLPATLEIDRRNPSQGVTIVAHYPNGTFVTVTGDSIDAALLNITKEIYAGTVSG